MSYRRILAGAVLCALSTAAYAQDHGSWAIYTKTDRMTSERATIASIRTTEPFELRFPYNGIKQTAELKIRQHPSHGGDVILSIAKGQLVCGVSNCPVRIRFDDDAPYSVDGSPASDGSSEFAFIPGFDRIVDRLGTADRMMVEIGIYQHGNFVFEFDVRGFDPAAFKQ